jgi:uncharacterized membrane protein
LANGQLGPTTESSSPSRVIPTWTEPPVAEASVLIGGPLGRHALVGRSRLWTPLRVVLLFAVLVLAAGWLVKAPCLQQMPTPAGLALDWRGDRQYVSMCYSDVVTLWEGERLGAGGLPYRTSWNAPDPDDPPNARVRAHYLDYPVLTGFFLVETARFTEHYRALAAKVPWLPSGLPEVVFFDVAAAAAAACWLTCVWSVASYRRWRPWDAALVALSPLALLHVFTGTDAFPVAAVAGALYAQARGRPWLAGALLGLAAAAKPFAAIVLLAFFAGGSARSPRPVDTPGTAGGDTPGTAGGDTLRTGPRTPIGGVGGAGRAALATVAVWLVLNVPVALFASRGWWAFFDDSLREDPGPDSVYYLLSYLTGWPRFDWAGPPWSVNIAVLVLLVVAVLGVLVVARRAPLPPRPESLAFLLVAATLLVNKSWSPQFSLWLVPLAVLALPRWRLLFAWMTIDALVWVPRMFFYVGVDDKGLPAEPFLVMVVIRDAVVILLMTLVARTILVPATDPVRASWQLPALPESAPESPAFDHWDGDPYPAETVPDGGELAGSADGADTAAERTNSPASPG